MKIAFLYTLEANIALFKPYIKQYLGDKNVTVTHHVNEALLQQAMKDGPTQNVLNTVQKAIVDIDKAGANYIICTCSTIGDLAESTPDVSAKVIRVDRTMADKAITHERILVLAALASTLDPTLKLLTACASQQNKAPSITTQVIPDVWAYYSAGDTERYVKGIANYINHQDSCADIIVLAQASMAPAMTFIHPANSNVLTSPKLCLQQIAAEVDERQDKKGTSCQS
ncbi:hypothetical protein L4D09_17725 [Photobacterium makurazakiensis]|uniref:hypothetical protein n=1 Tax=Photobacterium makurazakiensis TaxID=2910234 RepID=UPI003D109398